MVAFFESPSTTTATYSHYDGGTASAPWTWNTPSWSSNSPTVPFRSERREPRERNPDGGHRAWTIVLAADPKPSKDDIRRLLARLESWAAIARREREILHERVPAPKMPPRPRPGRRRVTSPAERYRVLV